MVRVTGLEPVSR